MKKPLCVTNLGRRRFLGRGLAAFSIFAGFFKALPARASGLTRFTVTNPSHPVPDIVFLYGETTGDMRRLSDFKGQVVLLNIWATWCAPCVLEMPALDALQAELGGSDFTVLPVSLDRGSNRMIREFYDEHGITKLPIAVDFDLNIARKLNPRAMPLSLLIDRQGREVGRCLGGEEWDSDDAIELIRGVMNS